MWDSIIPVTYDHDPIVAEGTIPISFMVFNAGPANINALVWSEWGNQITINGESLKTGKEPDFQLELRPGNQRIITGSFIRLQIKASENTRSQNKNEFAAVGIKPYR